MISIAQHDLQFSTLFISALLLQFIILGIHWIIRMPNGINWLPVLCSRQRENILLIEIQKNLKKHTMENEISLDRIGVLVLVIAGLVAVFHDCLALH